MLVLVCDHPHCSGEATDEVVHPSVRWLLCPGHADAERVRAGALRAVLRQGHRGGFCLLSDCARRHHARGLCCRHYHQARRRGLLPDRLQRRAEARLALVRLPGTPPTFSFPLSDQPVWVQRAANRSGAAAWAAFRQELHRVAGVPL